MLLPVFGIDGYGLPNLLQFVTDVSEILVLLVASRFHLSMTASAVQPHQHVTYC